MRRDPRNINEYRKASSDTFASVVRSFGELNRSLQGIAEEMTETSKNAVGRVIEIQAELAKKAYETYLSEVSKLGRMYLAGYGMFVAPAETLPSLGLTKEASAKVQRTAAHRVSTKRKTGNVAKRRSGSKRSHAEK
jgi:hypothetical protein